jgi:hypothetical protein
MNINNFSKPCGNDGGTEIDITELVNEACESLSYSNPLVCKKETFNLYDSMSALDLMEPKMDGCQIPIEYYENAGNDGNDNDHGDSSLTDTAKERQYRYVPPRPIPHSISESSLVWDMNTNVLGHTGDDADDDEHTPKDVNVATRQVAVILLEMLVRLESLLSGNSVAESIYTCIYAHNSILNDMQQQLRVLSTTPTLPLTLKLTAKASKTLNLQKAIFLATVLMVKLSQNIRNIVKRADIYEEEDFNVTTNQFDFYPAYGDGDGDGDGDDDDADNSSMQQLWTDVHEVKNILRDEFLNKSQDDSMRDNVEIILHVLDYMANLHDACTTLTNLSKDNVIANATSLQNTIFDNHAKMQQFIQLRVLNNANMEYTAQDKQTIFRTFDPYMNRHLLGNAPVRHVIFSPPAIALKNLSQTYKDLGHAACNLLLKGDTLGRIRRILSKLSNPSMSDTSTDKHVTPTTVLNILTRSLIVINLYFDDMILGRHPIPLLIANDMQRYAIPQILTASDYGTQFLNRLCKPIYDTLKLYTLNRNRQRNYLDTMFRDWKVLQKDASSVDLCFQKEFQLDSRTTLPYVSNYTFLTTVGLMDHHIGLGVELELFHGHYHLMTAFWYRDFLLSAKLNVVTSVRKHLKERKAMEAQIAKEEAEAEATKSKAKSKAADTAKGKKKSKKGGKRGNAGAGKKSGGGDKVGDSKLNASAAVQPAPEDDEDNAEFLLLSVERTMCRGIVRVSFEG